MCSLHLPYISLVSLFVNISMFLLFLHTDLLLYNIFTSSFVVQSFHENLVESSKYLWESECRIKHISKLKEFIWKCFCVWLFARCSLWCITVHILYYSSDYLLIEILTVHENVSRTINIYYGMNCRSDSAPAPF